MQAVQGHPQAGVGVLFSTHAVNEPQGGVPRAAGVEQADQGVAPSGVVGGPQFATAVVEVLIGALVEAFPQRCWPWVVLVRKGVVQPVVPVPGRLVWHRQAARVAVSQLGGTQRDDIDRGALQLEVGRPGAPDGVAEPIPEAARVWGMRSTQYPPRQGCELQDGMVPLGADAMGGGDLREYPGGLGTHGGRLVVDERAHEGHGGLLAPCRHLREPQGPVVL